MATFGTELAKQKSSKSCLTPVDRALRFSAVRVIYMSQTSFSVSPKIGSTMYNTNIRITSEITKIFVTVREKSCFFFS